MWALKTKENKSINISWVIKFKSRILPLPGLCRPQALQWYTDIPKCRWNTRTHKVKIANSSKIKESETKNYHKYKSTEKRKQSILGWVDLACPETLKQVLSRQVTMIVCLLRKKLKNAPSTVAKELHYTWREKGGHTYDVFCQHFESKPAVFYEISLPSRNTWIQALKGSSLSRRVGSSSGSWLVFFPLVSPQSSSLGISLWVLS